MEALLFKLENRCLCRSSSFFVFVGSWNNNKVRRNRMMGGTCVKFHVAYINLHGKLRSPSPRLLFAYIWKHCFSLGFHPHMAGATLRDKDCFMFHLINKIMSASAMAYDSNTFNLRRNWDFLLITFFSVTPTRCVLCVCCSAELVTLQASGGGQQIVYALSWRSKGRPGEGRRRSYFDKINWCAIMEGVVVRKFMTGIFHPSVMCAQQYFLST